MPPAGPHEGGHRVVKQIVGVVPRAKLEEALRPLV
jgi:hypothetical protein